ncbi:alpha/beta hydrolase family protein [Idiomarina aquatica]|uniref:S9 family peptidase n=1 Tax=Idiomarina aquatica TaxID=1327752 RepID=A0AA94JDS6_9GAMM|nr:S9 family peptidase [Idiomarina aquatica]RUO45107.1 S9 family peptidase [Idiomarina aquatica]
MKRLIASILSGLALSTSVMAADVVNESVLEKYAKHAQFMNIKISPEGKYLAATSRTPEGGVILTVLDIDDQKVLSVTRGRGTESVSDFNWVSDERIVMTMAREVGSYETPFPTGEIFAMDADGGNQKILTGWRSDGLKQYARIIDLLPDEPDQVMIYSTPNNTSEPYVDIYRLKVDSGRTMPVGRVPVRRYEGTGVQVFLDDEGVTRLATGEEPHNTNEKVIMTRPGANEEWKEVARYGQQEGNFNPIDILPDGKTVIGLSDVVTDALALTTMNLDTGEIEVIAEHPETDLMPIVSVRNGRMNEVIGAAYEYDGIDTVFFADVDDEYFSSVVQSLTKAFPNKSVGINSATLDNSKMIVSVSSANYPTEFYLFDAENRALSLIIKAKPWLDKETIPKTEIITYQARDGLTIKALLTLPKGKEAKDLPLILLPHGGPHGPRDTLTRLDSDAKVLAEHGYAVLQPNFRGSGGYGKEFLQSGYKNWGTTMINDMTDGVMHLIDEGIANKDRMCVYGGSYGGYAALMTVIREPDLYNCTIGFVGVYDLNMMRVEGDIPETLSGMNYLDMALPDTEEARAAQSPVDLVDKLKVPVFIIQGGKDVRVPPEQAYALRDALEAKDHPYEWMYKENEGHGFYKPENNIERWTRMLQFLDQHIDG